MIVFSRLTASHPRLKVWTVVSVGICIALLKASLGLAQVTPAITPTTGAGGLGTTVTQAGNTYDITGGTRPSNGPNLFHSFGEFGVPTNHIANFLNETALPTSNILGRVTGGNPSNIFGTLQTTGFGSANLFLMNPAGIVFGPNASLNVGGSVSFTTADYLRLTDGAKFNAIPGPADAAISSAPVAAFGFLGSNPAAITVQGGQLCSLGRAWHLARRREYRHDGRREMAPHSRLASQLRRTDQHGQCNWGWRTEYRRGGSRSRWIFFRFRQRSQPRRDDSPHLGGHAADQFEHRECRTDLDPGRATGHGERDA